MAELAESVKGDVTVVDPTRTQRTIARRIAEAKATVPEFTLQAEIDVAQALQRPEPLLALVVRAAGQALREVPRANAAYRDGKFELYSRANVGVTVDTEDAYVVPTIFDADRRTPAEIAAALDELADRARAGTITSPDL